MKTTNEIRYMEDTETTASSRYGSLCNLAWSKMNDYYSLTDSSNSYLVAAILDPRLNIRYFEKQWPSSWRISLRSKLFDYTEHFMKAMGLDANVPPPTANAPTTSASNGDDEDEEYGFGSWRNFDDDDDDEIISPVMDVGGRKEWEQYLKLDHVKIPKGTRFSLRDWWLSNSASFPVLSRMALDLLAVPAMSTEVERVFSGYFLSFTPANSSTKLTLSPLRNRLGPDAVAAIEVCTALYKRGLFADLEFDD